ncbi:MAG TPA: CapA family protein, partial [Epulopiscium sp.]|nr:CapA family protein [Candidatus Epulonipiscium sp.]
RGKPEFTEILKHGNVEAVNLANNHTYDYFQKGYDDTIAALKKAGISYFGLDHQSINNIKGINIGNLGYKGWNNSKWVKDGIKKDIAAMKQKTDILIVTFHWGDEGSNYPNSIQKDLGKFAIDQGADLVLGHHPHVMQGIEKYKDKYIVYSLGNFCFGGNRNPSDKDTFIFQQNFILDQNKKISSTDISIIPCTVSSVKYRNDYCPTPQKGQEGDRIMNRLNQYSKGFNATYY